MIPRLRQAQHLRGERAVEGSEQVAAGGEEPVVGEAWSGHRPRRLTRQARRLSALRPRRQMRGGGMIPGLQQAQHPRGERTVEEGEQVAAGGEEAAAGDEGPMVGMAQ